MLNRIPYHITLHPLFIATKEERAMPAVIGAKAQERSEPAKSRTGVERCLIIPRDP
jgi:hypothetical protein